MLISLKKKFIFIANLKAASSAIEQTLEPLAEIAVTDTASDKHLPFSELERRFGHVFETVSRDSFLIFGVVRDPVDFLISLYNSHTHRSFRIVLPRLYTGGMNFDDFLDKWCFENDQQTMAQYTRFIDKEGAIAANYIIAYDRLLAGLQYVAAAIEAPQLLSLPQVNVSNRRLRRADLTARQLARIAAQFAEDEYFLRHFCNRRLSPDDQRAWHGLT